MKTFIVVNGKKTALFKAKDIVHAIELTRATTYNNKFATVEEVVEFDNYTDKIVSIGTTIFN